jgi:dTDP-4-amino-4,6-dideoxygalactose transaminase
MASPHETRALVPFFDLKKQLAAIRPEIDHALATVLEDGTYTNGPAVEAFEHEFAAYGGVKHAVAVTNGTCALQLALECLDVGPGDEVVTVSMSFIATVWGILHLGATPVFVDVDPDRMTMDPAALERAITAKTKAILVVHLYGQMADMDPILATARARGIPVVEDCAQAVGAEFRGRRAGSLGRVGCFSFYPSKNLGAYGEGGAVVTDDDRLAERSRRLRNQGQQERYLHTDVGYNFRMNSFEGAILSVKLRHLEAWTARRNELARTYDRLLEGVGLTAPKPCPDGRHVYHLYVVRHGHREALRAALLEAGIETAVHYPLPIHLQPVMERYGYREGSLPVTEEIARNCVSLPLYPEMPDGDPARVVEALRAVLPALAPDAPRRR